MVNIFLLLYKHIPTPIKAVLPDYYHIYEKKTNNTEVSSVSDTDERD